MTVLEKKKLTVLPKKIDCPSGKNCNFYVMPHSAFVFSMSHYMHAVRYKHMSSAMKYYIYTFVRVIRVSDGGICLQQVLYCKQAIVRFCAITIYLSLINDPVLRITDIMLFLRYICNYYNSIGKKKHL